MVKRHIVHNGYPGDANRAMNECDVIANLWLQLNPHAQVHGCQVDTSGSVFIYILYSRNKKQHPLELCIGNPPKAVIRGLRLAINAEARTKRLTASGSRRIDDSEMPGNSIAGEMGERDK